MAVLTYFTLTGVISNASGSAVIGGAPGLRPVYGDVTITPLINTGDALQATTLAPPTVLFLTPTKARISYSILKYEGAAGVRLVANTAALSLVGELVYRITYTNLVSGGVPLQLQPTLFAAPTTDTVVDLVNAIPVPGSGAAGALRGPAGAPVDDVQFVDVDTIQFYVSGVAIGDPIELPDGAGTAIIDGGTP